MSTVAIVNPRASAIDTFAGLVDGLEARADTEVHHPTGPEQARRVVERAAQRGADRLVVFGGDGTLNLVANVLGGHPTAPPVALVPAGTGNDFARTLDLPDHPDAVADWLAGDSRRRPVDLMEVSGRQTPPGDTRLAVNAVHGGYAGEVTEEVDDAQKERLGPFAYLAAVPTSWSERTSWKTRVTWEDGSAETLDVLDIVVANGRTVGGGFNVAPDARPDDATLETLLIRSGGLLDLAGVAASLAAGTLPESDHVIHRSTAGLRIASTPPMQFNLDGEPTDTAALEISIRPAALTMLVPGSSP